MKNTILFLSIIILSLGAKAQDSLWVTSLNLKAGTIKLIVSNIRIDETTARTYLKWSPSFASNPNNNSNVSVDSIRVTLLASIYQNLMDLPGGLIKQGADYVNDFTTSIQSKRNGNTFLDRLCTNIESFYSLRYTNNLTIGNNLLKGTSN